MAVRLPVTQTIGKARVAKDFSKNNKVLLPIEDGDYITDAYLMGSGSIGVANGAANGTAKYENNAAGLLNRIKWLAASRGRYPNGPLLDVEPRTIICRRVVDKGRAVRDAAINGAIATYTVDFFLWLRRSLPTAPVPYETALPAFAYKGMQLEVACGDQSNILTGNDRTWDFSGLKLTYLDQRERQAMGNPDKGVLYESDQRLLIPAAKKDLGFDDFPIDEGDIYDVLIMPEQGAAMTLSDAILNKVTVKFGDLFYEMEEAELKHTQKDMVFDAAESMTGIYYVGQNPGGRLYGAVPNKEARDYRHQYDVANPSGANLDALLIASRRLVLPEAFGGTLRA